MLKKYLNRILLILLLSIIGLCCIYYNRAKNYKSLYQKEYNNVKAFEAENGGLNAKVLEYKYTIEDLEASRDSVNNKLITALEELKIKKKNVNSIQYITSVVQKRDTITLVGDTIFRDNFVSLDTTLQDQWYKLNVVAQYPSTLIIDPTFKSEKYVVIHNEKEYVKKPSKIFFIRWFQKKHTVTTIDIYEKNPYIENKESRFINIVK